MGIYVVGQFLEKNQEGSVHQGQIPSKVGMDISWKFTFQGLWTLDVILPFFGINIPFHVRLIKAICTRVKICKTSQYPKLLI